MTYLLLTAIIAALHYAVRRWNNPQQDYPDGTRYLAAGAGTHLHRPFHLRWLLPWLLRDDRRAWRVTTGAATIALAPLTYLFLLSCGLDADRAFVGSLLVLGLPGVFRMGVVGPYLVDAVAMALVLIAATLFRTDHALAAVAVTFVAAMVKESAFAFIACIGSPLALVGIVPVILRHVMSPPSDDDLFGDEARKLLVRPFVAGQVFHAGRWFSPGLMLIPWGGALIGFAAPEPWVIATVALAYAQLAVATDTVRLYQWAFPAVVFAAASVMPMEFAGLFVLGTWFNVVGEGSI